MKEKTLKDGKGGKKKPLKGSASNAIKSKSDKPKRKKPSAGPKTKIGKPKSKKASDKTKSTKSLPAVRQAIRNPKSKTKKPSRHSQTEIRKLKSENADLRTRLAEAEETLNAIRAGEVDALVVSGPGGDQVYALKGAEQPYRILVESMNEGALSVMKDGAIINCNKAFADIAGMTCGMLVGRKFREFVSKKDLQRFDLFWKQADESEARTEIELIFGGRPVPVFISASTRLIEGECWFFVVVTDITERRRTESELNKYRHHLEKLVDEKTEELQAINEELQTVNEELHTTNEELITSNEEISAKTEEFDAIFRNMADAVIFVSPDHKVLMCNPAAERMFGYRQDELNDLTTEILYADRSDHERILRELSGRSASAGMISMEVQCRSSNGTIFLGEIVISRIRGHGGISGFIKILRDITARKLAEEKLLRLTEDLAARNLELESLNKELDAFVYSVSHDLRAPLRIMEGFAKIVSETYTDKLDEEGKNYLTRIRLSSKRMSQLIEDLLRLSLISRQEIRATNCDLSHVASSVIYGLRQADPARNVDVVIEEGLRADIDPDLMKIAISNLLSNAWKFTSVTESARIEFGTTDQDCKAVYFVRDNGVGFDPAFASKMFLPFQRLHTQKEFEGTGIGLSIVERIIRRHGGRVWAEGEVGKGTTVYFTLG